MLTIAFDMDDTTFDLINPWLDNHYKMYGEKINKEHIKDFSIHQYSELGEKIYDSLAVPGLYRNLKPYEGSSEVLEYLVNKGYNVCFASASPKTAYFEKHISIKKNFHFIDTDNIIFTKNKGLVNAHILIDDGIHNLENFKGIKILYDQPWNRYEDRFIRVKDWVDIKNLFKFIDSIAYNLGLYHVKVNSETFFNVVEYIFSNTEFIVDVLANERGE